MRSVRSECPFRCAFLCPFPFCRRTSLGACSSSAILQDTYEFCTKQLRGYCALLSWPSSNRRYMQRDELCTLLARQSAILGAALPAHALRYALCLELTRCMGGRVLAGWPKPRAMEARGGGPVGLHGKQPWMHQAHNYCLGCTRSAVTQPGPPVRFRGLRSAALNTPAQLYNPILSSKYNYSSNATSAPHNRGDAAPTVSTTLPSARLSKIVRNASGACSSGNLQTFKVIYTFRQQLCEQYWTLCITQHLQ